MKLSNIPEGHTIQIGHVDIKGAMPKTIVLPDDVPVIPTRNLVLFPGVTIPISLVRENSLTVANVAKEKKLAVGIICQRDPEDDSPTINSIYNYGVLADIVDVIELPDGSHTAIVRARKKFKVLGEAMGVVIPEAEISVRIKEVREIAPKADDKEFHTIVEQIRTISGEIMGKNGIGVQGMLEMMMANEHAFADAAELINNISTGAPFDTSVKMDLLTKYRLKERAFALYEELVHCQEKLNIVESVTQRARESFDSQMRRSFLQRQMEAIDQELNGEEGSGDVAEFTKRLAEMNLDEALNKRITKEIGKLDRISQQTPDYSVQYAYIEALLDLPWNKKTEPTTDFKQARETLNNNHYGLEKVKERILEQIAVIMNNPTVKAPIICLVGPPGVGKTSLGQSIADALGRKFQRVSLGGLHDEAEIRGHRRTYIGAMPGRIIDAVRRAGTSNPVLLLDEVDKIGNDYKGDPASALLEVLDPEQNCKFHDNYIDYDFDLSNVFFIATANTLSGVSQPLVDRMEVIDLSGYILEEKTEIAKNYLIGRVAERLGLDPTEINITNEALTTIIEGYTAESGVRQLEKAIASIARKIVLAKVENGNVPAVVDSEAVRRMLGVEKFSKERYEGNETPGVVTGLAWTAVGGEILFIESSLSEGKEQKLTLTGNLGDVMKESAMIALQYVKSHATEIGIDPEMFGKYNVHVHVPEGAIPKDGPSAGITMATSIASTFTGCLVRPKLAMTGEITLRGKVMPVGGIKEKILAAKRAGINTIILSAENRKDVEDIAECYRQGLDFIYVKNVAEVLGQALIR